MFRLSAMGDVAMSVPVIRALLAQNPSLRVTVVSRGFLQPFFAHIDRCDFFAVDLKNRHKGIKGLLQLSRDLKALHIDAMADLHGVLRARITGFFLRFSGVTVVHINKGRAEKKALTRAKNKIFSPLKTTPERYADVFRSLRLTVDLSRVPAPVLPVASGPVIEWLNKPGRRIGIAPFAQHAGKVYPADLMQHVIDNLAAKNHNVFLFGAGQTETNQLRQFSGTNPNIIVVAGSMPLSEELGLIARLDIMLSMDSANAHMAAMYGVPVVTLWGATHPYAGFGPFGQPLSHAICANREQFPLLPTSVYGNKMIPGYENAMRSIDPETIVQKIETLLASKT